MEHPEELSKVAGLQKKVDEVKNVMVDNIEQVHLPSSSKLTQQQLAYIPILAPQHPNGPNKPGQMGMIRRMCF